MDNMLRHNVLRRNIVLLEQWKNWAEIYSDNAK